MIKRAWLAAVLLPVLWLQQASAQNLQRVSPESAGVSSKGIINFLDDVAKSKNEFHSFVLLRHGNVVAEGWWNPYKPELKHQLYSTSKSFTSTAVGFAVSEGKLKLTDKVVFFFPESVPDTANAFLKNMTVKNLLTMSTGQRSEPHIDEASKDTWVQQFMKTPITDTPGHTFRYNSIATYMLSAIVQKVTGQKVLDYLQTRLFLPLQITGADWETSPQDINTGGWGLRLKTMDLAKFGQLMLQKGKWKGKTVVPQNWVEEATTFKIKNAADTALTAKANSDWAQGYGYQFWRCRHNAFRADGAFGQYIIVMPDQDAVLAITSETASMQDELNLVWKNLLPAMQNGTLPEDKAAQQNLQNRLGSLKIAMPAKGVVSAMEKEISGKTFNVDSNTHKITKLSFTFSGDECRYTVNMGSKAYNWLAGRNKRVDGTTTFPFSPPSLTQSVYGKKEGSAADGTSASFSWTSANTLELAVRYPESAHSEKFICTFYGKKVSVKTATSTQRITQSSAALPEVRGTM